MRASTGRRCNNAGSLTSSPVNGFTLAGRAIGASVDGAIFLKYSINGAIVHTVKPPPAGAFCDDACDGGCVAAAWVGSGKGVAVLVGSAVAVGMICVGGGFDVAVGMGVRVG
jgi:hypothetical protein